VTEAPVWIKGVVNIGAGLKARLAQAARLEEPTPTGLARQVLREHLSARERPPGERSCLPGAASALER
jgi:hypothetical protein